MAVQRTHRRLLAVMTALMTAPLTLLVGPGGVAGQDGAEAPLTVDIAAVGADGVAGLALLGPTGQGTAVHVLVVGAPAGTTAVIHPGDCTAPDATLVALVGDAAAGQAQTTVPVAFETLTDGGHSVGLHPGLDMATFVGCGAIPAVAAPAEPADPGSNEVPATPLPAPSSVEPIPTLPPPPTPIPVAADPACAGVAEWVAATEARLTRIGEALSELNTIAGRYDLNGYLSGLASLEGELGVMAARQSEEPEPPAASDVDATAIATYGTFADAARQIHDSLTVSVDVGTYSRAMTRYDEATKLMADVQRAIGELKARCAVG